MALDDNVLHTVILMYDFLVFVNNQIWASLHANSSFSFFLDLHSSSLCGILLLLLLIHLFLLLEHFLLVKVVGFRSSLE